jgi:hypothetical protein
MGLETLLKVWNWGDEQVLRQHTKLVNKWEEKGKNRRRLAAHLLTSSVATYLVNLTMKDQLWGGLFMPQFATYHTIEVHSADSDEITEGARAVRYEECILPPLIRAWRLPLFVAGTAALAHGAYKTIDGGVTGDYQELHQGIEGIFFGYALLSTAAASYVLDSDPKLLDKEPFWKKAYNSVKERIQGVLPSPAPLPAPAFTSSLASSERSLVPIPALTRPRSYAHRITSD